VLVEKFVIAIKREVGTRLSFVNQSGTAYTIIAEALITGIASRFESVVGIILIIKSAKQSLIFFGGSESGDEYLTVVQDMVEFKR